MRDPGRARPPRLQRDPGCRETCFWVFFLKKIISLSPLMNTFRIAVVFVVLFVRIVDVAVVLFVVKVKRCKV